MFCCLPAAIGLAGNDRQSPWGVKLLVNEVACEGGEGRGGRGGEGRGGEGRGGEGRGGEGRGGEGREGKGGEGTRTRMMLVMRRECWFLTFAWILE